MNDLVVTYEAIAARLRDIVWIRFAWRLCNARPALSLTPAKGGDAWPMPRIHLNARAAPVTWAGIARSGAPAGLLARSHGIGAETIRKRRERGTEGCLDHSAKPRRLTWKATEEERALACAARRAGDLPFGGLAFVASHSLPRLAFPATTNCSTSSPARPGRRPAVDDAGAAGGPVGGRTGAYLVTTTQRCRRRARDRLA